MPDMGDLVAMDVLAEPAVSISHVGEVSQDLDLDTVMPF